MSGHAAASFAMLLLAAADAPEWVLMGRHGECAPVETLKRKLPDLPGEVRDPKSFEKFVRGKGHAVTTRETATPRMVEVTVPSLELSLVFVPPTACVEGVRKR